jgi:hypothetical protein
LQKQEYRYINFSILSEYNDFQKSLQNLTLDENAYKLDAENYKLEIELLKIQKEICETSVKKGITERENKIKTK